MTLNSTDAIKDFAWHGSLTSAPDPPPLSLNADAAREMFKRIADAMDQRGITARIVVAGEGGIVAFLASDVDNLTNHDLADIARVVIAECWKASGRSLDALQRALITSVGVERVVIFEV